MVSAHLLTFCAQLVRDRRFAEAEAECDKALAGRLTSSQRSQLLLIKAHTAKGVAGKWNSAAISSLRDALHYCGQWSEARGRVLATLTEAYATVCSLPFCKEYHDQFVELHVAKPTHLLSQWRPDVEYNLAIAYHEEDRLDEAEDHYLLAHQMCVQSDDPYVRSLLPHIEHNLVDVFQELDRHEEAFRLMQAAYSLLADESHGAQKRNRHAAYALFKNDVQAALLWVESGLGHPSCDERTRAALTLTKAKIADAAGNGADAEKLGLEAKRLAREAHSNRLCRRASSFLSRLRKGELQ